MVYRQVVTDSKLSLDVGYSALLNKLAIVKESNLIGKLFCLLKVLGRHDNASSSLEASD